MLKSTESKTDKLTDMNYMEKSKDELINELLTLKNENDWLQAALIKRDIEKQKCDVILRERLKEIRFHNLLSEIISHNDYNLEEICEKIVQIIPNALQFPEAAEAAIFLSDKTFKTPGFHKSKHVITEEIRLDEMIIGRIEIGYPDEKLPDADCLFLPEEYDLLFTIRVRLTGLIEIKQKDIKLNRSEAEYRHLIEDITDVVYRVDLQGVIRYISPSIKKILGFTPQEIIGKNFLDFVGENSEFLSQRFLLLRQNINIEGDYTILNKSGETHWIRLSTKAIFENEIFMGGTGTLIDITEKKLIQLELQKSESLYRSILNASPDVFAILDSEAYVRFISPKALTMFGYEHFDQFTGRSIIDFVHPKEYQGVREAIDQIKQGIVPKLNEYILQRADGTNFSAEIDGDFIRDPDGNNTQMIFIIRDITDRKVAEEKLKESEETYRNLVEKINDVIYEISMDGKIRYISPVIEKLLGYKAEFLIGTSFLDYVYEPDRQFLIDRLMLEHQENNQFVEYRYFNKAGELRWVRSSATVLKENDVVVGKSGTIIDITEKKQSEELIRSQNERMSAILSAMPDLIFVMDKEGTYLEYFAENVDDLLAPKADLIGMKMKDIFEEATANLHLSKIRECIESKQLITYDFSVTVNHVLSYYEARLILLSDEKVFRFVRNITNRKNAENEIINLNKNLENKIIERTAELAQTNEDLLREIEERKRVEEDLRRARQEADKANLAKSEFLSRMSHELRTPMNSILGFAQLLDMGELNAGQKKGVRHILHSGKILLDLINEVLDISRIESGHLSLSLEPVQLSSVISQMLDIVSPLASQRKINLEWTASPYNQLFLMADRQRLKQVLINLLTNAIKYNQTGGKITVRVDRISGVDPNVPFVRVFVIDTGLGIAPENLQKVFQPFERIGAEKSETEGTGLGLAVVKQLVEAMNGHIGVESSKDLGSNFWFELPETSDASFGIGNESLKNPGPGRMHQAMTILYIEDCISNIELVEQILSVQRSGIRFITSKKGMEAVSVASQVAPDLILLDVNQADATELEVLSLLTSDFRTMQIPVVVISEETMPNQIEKLMNAGAKRLLNKPVDLSALLKVVDEFLVD